MKNDFTIVTGLWDLGRGDLTDFKRPFDQYLESFSKLLSLDFNMVIYIPEALETFVLERRNLSNTRIVIKELKEFDKWLVGFDKIQQIRENPEWYNLNGWLQNSPQAKLRYYNAIQMSKFYMLNDSAIINTYGSSYLFWLDGGITNTVSLDYLREIIKLPSFVKSVNDKFIFLSFPYESDIEVHGFKSDKFNEYCGVKSTYVCRGGFFGGNLQKIKSFTGEYYHYLNKTLDEGFMGADECIYTILSHKLKDNIFRFELEPNGFVYKFFESLQNFIPPIKANATLIEYDSKKPIEDIKTSLYVLTYNSPAQFFTLVNSYLKADSTFISKPRKILIDNSTDISTYGEYNTLCKFFGFEHIKKTENVGICGGRQFVAEHFNESDSEYYIFLEDDMLLHKKTDELCAAGKNRFVEDLYLKSLAIMHKERYDFLKLSFAEFYGTNEIQWAWYNVSQSVREKFFTEKPNLPVEGLDHDPPKLIPTSRKRHKGLYYLEGEYYYCNWPIWFSRIGNQKVFLDVKWARPFEQTWMSHVFQLQKQGKVKSAILDLSPINHHRFDFYPSEERKES